MEKKIPIDSPVPIERIQQLIILIRGKKVMLDSDLAKLYGVSTKRLNEQVKRNRDRFPADFIFQLNPAESEGLRSQFATSKMPRGGRRYLPFAFTEHGAIVLAAALNTLCLTLAFVFPPCDLRLATCGFRTFLS